MSSNAKGKAAPASAGNSKLPTVTKSAPNSKAPASNSTPNKNTANSASKSTPSKVEKLPAITPTGKGASKADPLPVKTENEMAPPTTETPVQDQATPSVTEASQNAPPAEASVPSETAASAPTVSEPPVEAPLAAPVEPPKPINNNGMVTLIYEQYNEQFPIVNGNTTHENIDEVYCLTFVMPNCKIHLSKYSPKEMRELEGTKPWEELYFREEPMGTYHDLEADQTYYVYAEQEADQLKRDQERMRKIASTMEGAARKGDGLLPKDDGRGMESCSCIYGNPCVDEYGCKDWSNRYAVATKNGWKGF